VAGIVKAEQRADLRRVMQNAQRLLKPWRIANDYAPQLTFSSGRTRTRRDHDKYLTLIDAIALLHQHQRQPITKQINGRTIEMLPVMLEDIATANRLAPEILGRSLDELPPQTRRLLGHIRELVAARMEGTKQPQSRCLFSRRELREACGWSEFQARTHLEKLEALEYIARRHGRQGVGCLHELLMDCTATEDHWHVGLIEPEKLRHGHDASLVHPAGGFVQNEAPFEVGSSGEAHEAPKPGKQGKAAA
jgi:hypothetical protein